MKSLALLTVLLISVSLTTAAPAGNKLNIGDPAPPLKLSKCFKGDPIDKLEAGNVYVVEFWATWCGPCKVSIPHLTEVAHKFKGKARIIGVSVWERAKDDAARFELIEKFVKDMGAKMDYTVVADDAEGTMAKTWMQAAGENGIPSSFIVGKDGKIAWIGHPMSGLDQALEQVIDGKFDSKAYAEKRAEDKAAQSKQRELMTSITALRKEGKNQEALAELDKAITEHPALARQMVTYRLSLLMQVDEAAGLAEVRKLAEGEYKDNARYLSMFAGLVSNPRLKAPDHALALRLAESAAGLQKDDPMILSALADAYNAADKSDKAVETLKRAIELLEKKGDAPAATLKFLKSKLERYSQGK